MIFSDGDFLTRVGKNESQQESRSFAKKNEKI